MRDLPKKAAIKCEEVITLAPPTDKDSAESEKLEENEQNNYLIMAKTINIAALISMCSLTQL